MGWWRLKSMQYFLENSFNFYLKFCDTKNEFHELKGDIVVDSWVTDKCDSHYRESFSENRLKRASRSLMIFFAPFTIGYTDKLVAISFMTFLLN